MTAKLTPAEVETGLNHLKAQLPPRGCRNFWYGATTGSWWATLNVTVNGHVGGVLIEAPSPVALVAEIDARINRTRPTAPRAGGQR